MPSESSDLIRSLQGLRGVAALFVALHNLALWLPQPFSHNGYFFVDLFFVLSGFVITSAYADRIGSGRDLAGFLLRRFGRLFPLLIFATVLFVAARNAIPAIKLLLVSSGMGGALLHPDVVRYEWPTWWEAFTTLTLTHSLGTHPKPILNTASWSISTEFWAYVIFGALVLAIPRRKRLLGYAMLSALGVAVTAWAGIYVHNCLSTEGCLHLTYDFGLARCVFSFFLGAMIPQVKHRFRQIEAPVQIAASVMIFLLLWGVDRSPALAYAVPFVFALLIWSLARDTGPLARVLARDTFVELGARSYSIYLLHPVLVVLVYAQVHRVQSPWWTGVIALAYFAVLFVVAGWSYRHIEQPARRWFNSRAQRIDGNQPAAARVAERPSLQA